MKLTTGTGLSRFILSPVAVVAMLALLTTAVAFAATPASPHGPKNGPSVAATAPSDASANPSASEYVKARGTHFEGACNALHGNGPKVIAQLVANWPTKHPGKDVPPGLKKVADRVAECQGVPAPSESAAAETSEPEATEEPTEEPVVTAEPSMTASPIVIGDETRMNAVAKGVGHNR